MSLVQIMTLDVNDNEGFSYVMILEAALTFTEEHVEISSVQI